MGGFREYNGVDIGMEIKKVERERWKKIGEWRMGKGEREGGGNGERDGKREI